MLMAARSRWWVALPLAYMAAVQIASGIPHPQYFVAVGRTGEVRASVARVLFAPGEILVNFFHVPVFLVLMLLWCWALGAWSSSVTWRAGLAASLSLSFAVLNELSQALVPMRWASAGDGLANALGVAVGLLVFLYLAGIDTARQA